MAIVYLYLIKIVVKYIVKNTCSFKKKIDLLTLPLTNALKFGMLHIVSHWFKFVSNLKKIHP